MKMTLKNPDEIKIFILYLMDRIGYPLSYSDWGTIIIRDGTVDYFAFCEYFCELVESGLVTTALADLYNSDEHTSNPSRRTLAESDAKIALAGSNKNPRPTGEQLSDPKTLFTVSETGRLVARSLSENILMSSIREMSYISAMRHLSLEKRGAICDQSFEVNGDGFLFHCKIGDKDGTALDLSIRADTAHQLNRMRLNFDERPDVIMRGIIALLTGNVNYLFDE